MLVFSLLLWNQIQRKLMPGSVDSGSIVGEKHTHVMHTYIILESVGKLGYDLGKGQTCSCLWSLVQGI